MLNILICDDDKNIIHRVSGLLDEVKRKHNIDFKIDTNTDDEFSTDKPPLNIAQVRKKQTIDKNPLW